LTQGKLCELCGCEPAEFVVRLVTEISQGAEQNLCESCAVNRERILFGSSRLPLTALVKTLAARVESPENDDNRTKVCPFCGNTADEVERAGIVGCSTCYAVFQAEVDRVIRILHDYPRKSG
jgi:protein arginine kinase activator